MEDALEAGAADFSSDDGVFEITTEPDDLDAVRDALEQKGYKIASADLDKVPTTYVSLTNEDDINVLKTLTMSFKSKKVKKKSVKKQKEEDKKTVDKTPSKTNETPKISPVTDDNVTNDKLPSIEEEDAAEGKNRVLNEVLDLIDNKEI